MTGGTEVDVFTSKRSKIEPVIPSTSIVPPLKIITKVDSGASSHYIRPEDASLLSNLRLSGSFTAGP